MGFESRAGTSERRVPHKLNASFAGWGAILLLVLSVAGDPAAAQMKQSVDDPGVPVDDTEPGMEIHPDAVSSFVTRTYKISRKNLWKGLLSLLEESGYPPEEVDKKELTVKTRFIDFKSTDYSEEVGEAQPRISGDYTILQMRRVRVGKVSLEARISRGERGGTDLNIRARILVQGLDRKQGLLLLTDRKSSGVIEADFLRLLEDRLELERL